MAKKSSFANVYTGLLAGAVGGWFLHSLTEKKSAKTTLAGDALPYKDPVSSKYDEGWNAGLDGSYTFDGGDRAGNFKRGWDAAQAWKQSQGLALP